LDSKKSRLLKELVEILECEYKDLPRALELARNDQLTHFIGIIRKAVVSK